jgi:hypothetical protein
MEAGGILVMPPFKSGNRQFTSKENEEGYKCASVRIHIERCIERLKRFRILDFLPLNILKYIDDIIVIIAAVSNCLPDLVKQDENLNDSESSEEEEDGSV